MRLVISRIRTIVTITVWIILALSLPPNAAQAQVVGYIIDAVVDSAQSDSGRSVGPCWDEVGVPGTAIRIQLKFDYDLLQMDTPDCSEAGCSQNITGAVYKIRFIGSDACVIASETLQEEYVAFAVNQASIEDRSLYNDPQAVDALRITAIAHDGFQCLNGYDDVSVLGPPICQFSGAGDPSNSYFYPYFYIEVSLTESTASKFDGFVLPIDLGTLAAAPQFDGGFVTLTKWDPITFLLITIGADVTGIVPMTPSSLMADLIDATSEINASNGIVNSLDVKLDSALEALDDVNEKNDGAAINKLQAFINAVEAQRGIHIPDADADALIAEAQDIIDNLR